MYTHTHTHRVFPSKCTIHWLFSTFTELCNVQPTPPSILRYFYHLQKKSHTYCQSLPVSSHLPVLGNSATDVLCLYKFGASFLRSLSTSDFSPEIIVLATHSAFFPCCFLVISLPPPSLFLH